MTHAELTKIAERWLHGIGCGFVFRELVSQASETPDAVGFKGHTSILVECKVSRADYLRDRKKWFRREAHAGIGEYRYYMCPEGLIQPEELPEKWGLLYVSERGRVECIVNKTFRGHYLPSEWRLPFDWQAERHLFYTALRRLHLRGRIPEIYDQPWKRPTQTKGTDE